MKITDYIIDGYVLQEYSKWENTRYHIKEAKLSNGLNKDLRVSITLFEGSVAISIGLMYLVPSIDIFLYGENISNERVNEAVVFMERQLKELIVLVFGAELV